METDMKTNMKLVMNATRYANELYKYIMEHPAFAELNDAQADVNVLMNEVNSTITFHITGEKPSSCTHDCSTCGGGCH